MAGPDAGLAVAIARRRRMVLLDAQVLDGVASGPQGGQKLRTAVLQGLTPLGMAGTDGENLALQMQRSAVGCELFPCNGGPVLP